MTNGCLSAAVACGILYSPFGETPTPGGTQLPRRRYVFRTRSYVVLKAKYKDSYDNGQAGCPVLPSALTIHGPISSSATYPAGIESRPKPDVTSSSTRSSMTRPGGWPNSSQCRFRGPRSATDTLFKPACVTSRARAGPVLTLRPRNAKKRVSQTPEKLLFS